MMQVGEQFKMLAAYSFFATIAGMVLQGELSLRHPAAEGFGIDAEATTRLGHRQEGHGATPFVRCVNKNKSQPTRTPEKTPRSSPGKARWLNKQT
jgi:hypothetical protein